MVREVLLHVHAYYEGRPVPDTEADAWIRMGSMLLYRAVDLILHRFYRRALCRIIQIWPETSHQERAEDVRKITFAVAPQMQRLLSDAVAMLEAHETVVFAPHRPDRRAMRAYSSVLALIRTMERFISVYQSEGYRQFRELLEHAAAAIVEEESNAKARAQAYQHAVSHYWHAIKTRYPVMVNPEKGESIACEVLEEDAAMGYDLNDPKWKNRRETPRQRQQRQGAERRRLLDMMEGDTTDGPHSQRGDEMTRNDEVRRFLDTLPTPLDPHAKKRVVDTLAGLSDDDLPVVLGLIQYQADNRSVGIATPNKTDSRFPWLAYEVLPETAAHPTPAPDALNKQQSVMDALERLSELQQLQAAAIALDMSLSLLDASGEETKLIREYAHRMKQLVLRSPVDASQKGGDAAELIKLAQKVQSDLTRTIQSGALDFGVEQVAIATLQLLQAWAALNRVSLAKSSSGTDTGAWRTVWTVATLEGLEMSLTKVGGATGLARVQTFLRHWWSEVRHALNLDTARTTHGRLVRHLQR